MAALGPAGPGTEIIFGVNEEYSSSCSRLKFYASRHVITVVPCVFLLKPYGDVANIFCKGGVRINLPESG